MKSAISPVSESSRRQRFPEPSPLERVLAYELDELIFRFMKDHEVSETDARELFLETKKMLWLMAQQSYEREQGDVTPPDIMVYAPMGPLDEVWHTFILFTKEYTDFCRSHFGYFLHHAPTTTKERARYQAEWERDPEAAAENEAQVIREQCEYVVRHLGTDSLRLWFQELPARFPHLVPQ